jgi:hypothetical protein
MYTPDMCARTIHLVGQQWMPSNGTEGEIFWSEWCSHCERDKVMNGTVWEEDAGDGDLCQILSASFAGEATEWVYGADGQPTCSAFVPCGEPVRDRCPHTPDMFGMGVEA